MRHEILKNVKRLVIKIGSRILTAGENGLDREMIGRLATQVAWLRSKGCDVIVVSSGAVAAGRSALGLAERAGHAEAEAAQEDGVGVLERPGPGLAGAREERRRHGGGAGDEVLTARFPTGENR